MAAFGQFSPACVSKLLRRILSAVKRKVCQKQMRAFECLTSNVVWFGTCRWTHFHKNAHHVVEGPLSLCFEKDNFRQGRALQAGISFTSPCCALETLHERLPPSLSLLHPTLTSPSAFSSFPLPFLLGQCIIPATFSLPPTLKPLHCSLRYRLTGSCLPISHVQHAVSIIPLNTTSDPQSILHSVCPQRGTSSHFLKAPDKH